MRGFEVRFGDIISIEGRAIGREYQGRGIGAVALMQLITKEENFVAAASVTRNPAVLCLMQKGFNIVSPDLNFADDPMHHLAERPDVLEVSRRYSEHVGADPNQTPFVFGRYGGGLYGLDDPGRSIPITEISGDQTNGLVMVAMDRKDL